MKFCIHSCTLYSLVELPEDEKENIVSFGINSTMEKHFTLSFRQMYASVQAGAMPHFPSTGKILILQEI